MKPICLNFSTFWDTRLPGQLGSHNKMSPLFFLLSLQEIRQHLKKKRPFSEVGGRNSSSSSSVDDKRSRQLEAGEPGGSRGSKVPHNAVECRCNENK